MEGLVAAMKQSLIQLHPDNHGQHGNKRLLPHGSLEEDLGQTRTARAHVVAAAGILILPLLIAKDTAAGRERTAEWTCAGCTQTSEKLRADAQGARGALV